MLTTLASARRDRGALRFPAGRDYLVFAGSSRGGVVGEVGAGDRARRLSVRAGRYFVRGRGSDHLLEGELAVAAGDEHLVVDEELRRVEYARLVRKGTVLRSVSGPEAAAFVRTALISGRSPCLGVQGGWAIDLRQLTLRARAGVCRAGFANERVEADTLEVHGELRLSHAWDLAPFSVDLGLAAGAGLLHASFATSGDAPDRDSFALHTGAGPALTWHLGGGLEALAELAAQTFFFREQDASGAERFAAHFALQVALGVGLRF